MGRLLAIDYGTKRSGIAVTDPLRIIATALITVQSSTLRKWLKAYLEKEKVDKIIIGMPLGLDGNDTDATKPVKDITRLLKKDFPGLPIEYIDEQFTSKMAVRALIQSGVKKNKRQNKELIDQMAATLMLQEYLTRLT